ncbi:MAG: hypothetical protein CO105_14050 [Comamonadaceae bacterium CG_4_9_14_3_um_filter_60_33]|nr:MAG: hypothetical protein CO105_14050 [Comamonadaceae bacterium CG_4_9_14_3_um_filter_60_33]
MTAASAAGLSLYPSLSAVIEASRAAVTGQPIAWGARGITLCLCLIGAIIGSAFFQHSREEFADVL